MAARAVAKRKPKKLLNKNDCGTPEGHRYHRLILGEAPCGDCAVFRCGTEAEYAAHRKHGEPVDDTCRKARYAAVRQRRDSTKRRNGDGTSANANGKANGKVQTGVTPDRRPAARGSAHSTPPQKTPAGPAPVKGGLPTESQSRPTPDSPKRATTARDKQLDDTVERIVKQYGPGSVMRMGDEPILRPEVISTGALSLDIALGIGGVPRGRVVEVYGPESSGKTTLALHIVAEAQKQGGTAAFVDAEHCLDPAYAERVGVNVDDLLIAQPDNGEQALEIADMLVRSGGLDVLIVDSVAALVPLAELEGDMGSFQVGAQARLMSQALRKLAGNLARSRTTAVFLNQLREKIGVRFGNPETTPGGRALKFYASVRIDMRRIGSVKHRGGEVGNRVRAKVAKNKTAPPFRKAEFDIVFGQGISREGSILDTATEMGLIDRSGTWYSYEGEQLGQGRERAKKFLRAHPDTTRLLDSRIRRRLDLPTPQTVEEQHPCPTG